MALPEITGEFKPEEGGGAHDPLEHCSQDSVKGSGLGAPPAQPGMGAGVALLGFQTELINDLVSLSCKKTGNVFQGRKFSPAFKRFQCFVKPEQGGSPLGLAWGDRYMCSL